MKSNASISNHRSEVMLERSGRGALIGALVDRALCPRTLDIGAGPAAAVYALTSGDATAAVCQRSALQGENTCPGAYMNVWTHTSPGEPVCGQVAVGRC